MRKRFTINGKEYTSVAMDFNAICDLEDNGVSLATIKDKPMSAVRAYFALCFGGSKEEAGKEMEQHLVNGGNMEEVIDAMNKELEESDFFRSLSQNEDKETTANQSEQGKERGKA